MAPHAGPGSPVVFLGLARSCARYVAAFAGFLAAQRLAGLAVSAIVGENGSTDDTLARLLAAAAAGAPITLLDTAAMAAVAPRLRRMAVGRELLRRHWAETCPPGGHVCVIDLDDTLDTLPTPAAFIAALRRLEATPTAFAVSATSTPRYYDLLALRSADTDFAALQARIDAARRNPLRFYRFMRAEVFPAQRHITIAGARRCTSAFNGMCLYRGADYAQASYLAADNDTVCEHVVLNSAIHVRTGQYILIDPGLRVAAPRQHIAEGPAEFFALRAANAMRRSWARLYRS
jgi:hypothetical protein